MTNLDLELRKLSDSAKCMNCTHFAPYGPGSQGWGRCGLSSPKVRDVQDLSVCSCWQRPTDLQVKIKREAMSG